MHIGMKSDYFPIWPQFVDFMIYLFNSHLSQTKLEPLTGENQIDLGERLKYSTFLCSLRDLQKIMTQVNTSWLH